MSFLYITENGVSIGMDGGHIVLSYVDGHKEYIPKETVSAISIFGRSQLTAALTQFCLENGVRVGYFSSSGKYYGALVPTNCMDVFRLKRQLKLTENEHFCVSMSKKIIRAKVNNQLTVARRYLKELSYDNKMVLPLIIAKKSLEKSTDIAQLMGYEGVASKEYFKIISSIMEDDFKFDGRSRRPSRDPFNAMLNLGYGILSQEIIGEIESHGLCSYAGFMHKDKTGHASLASDMLEEWRAVIIDSTVLSMINGHEITKDYFRYEENACMLTTDGVKMLIAKLEKKMHTEVKYLKYINKPITFRSALWHQCESLAKAIDSGDDSVYNPIYIR